MKIQRLFANLCTDCLEDSKRFYTSLFQFNVAYASDWFVLLVSQGRELELGLIQAGHELVPKDTANAPAGFYLSIVVSDSAEVCARANTLGYEIVQEPKLTFYGQLRALIKDPAGVVVDVSSPQSD